MLTTIDANRAGYRSGRLIENRQQAIKQLNEIGFENYVTEETTIPGLLLIQAGQDDANYVQRVAQFDWEDFFLKTEGFFTGFADFLATRYEFVLIDSRTGIDRSSSICTMVLPSKLVVVFTPNTQSLTGVEELTRRAVHYRLKSADERPLQVFPLPSRISTDRPRLYQTWRYGGTTESSTVAIRGYQQVFEAVFAEVYGFASLQNQFED